MTERAIARKIRTHYAWPPIPCRGFDWQATFDDFEPGQPIGWGSTAAEATADLLSQVEE